MKNINPEGGEQTGSQTEQRSLARTLVLLVVVFVVNDIVIIRPLARKMAEQRAERLASETTAADGEDKSREILVELAASGSGGDAESPSGIRYVFLENDYLRLRVDSRGPTIDTLSLERYSDDIGNVRLLEPKKSTISLGWQAASGDRRVPEEDSLWIVESIERGGATGGNRGVTLSQRSEGLEFRITLAIDEKYMISVRQTVENGGKEKISLKPLWQIKRKNPRIRSRHEMFHFNGGLGVFDGRIQELKPKKIKNRGLELANADWAGVTSQYWLTAMVGRDGGKGRATFLDRDGLTTVQLTSAAAEEIPVGSSGTASVSIFAGAKDLKILRDYMENGGIKLLDRSVDFGLFYFLAKPLNSILSFLYRIVGNFGLAIVLLTIVIKIALYPVVKKSFITMSLMKEIQPKMKALQVSYGRDSEKFRREVIRLYEKYDLNPFASIVPVLLQIPVFFSLYRVISVSLDMRQAPFFWFIRDLSAADPTNLLNLFGLLPLRMTLRVGLLPCTMALTMYLQQRFSDRMMTTTPRPSKDLGPSSGPATLEKEISTAGAGVAKFMPLIFMFMFSSFPSGLLVYWILNNVITLAQQWYIFKNIKKWLARRKSGEIL
ncbi:MAG: membrane protein insertase YidC [Rickettsiales bacterium]|jgi:YidC/Oxa1 family membrane protein insertase|nr:membrane protein insertase YidC [Rickettsiales bacterium]